MYQINKTLLQILTTREQWQKLRSSIHFDRFDKEIRCVLKQIQSYWHEHDEDEMNMEVFVNKFYIDVKCSEQERLYYNKIFELMLSEPDEATSKDLIRNLRTMEFHGAVENAQKHGTLRRNCHSLLSDGKCSGTLLPRTTEWQRQHRTEKTEKIL